MRAEDDGVGEVTLVTRDSRLAEVVGSVAASVGIGVAAVGERAPTARAWRDEGPLLVGADMAGAVLGWNLPGRSGTHLVGFGAEEAARWSAALSASVVVLPEGSHLLGELLHDEVARGSSGHVVAISSACGGLGVSSLAAGVAWAVARSAGRVALVEMDADAGGVDLLVGAERQEGWRWPELASARGTTTGLAEHLPSVDGVDVVSAGRDSCPVSRAARRAVVESLSSDHDAVLVDPGAVVETGVNVDVTVGVVGADLRSVMAARRRDLPDVVVLRRGPGRSMSVSDVSSVLGVRPALVVGHDARLARGQESGEAPWVVASRRWRRTCQELAQLVVPDV